jgi:segregation and condensation protein B
MEQEEQNPAPGTAPSGAAPPAEAAPPAVPESPAAPPAAPAPEAEASPAAEASKAEAPKAEVSKAAPDYRRVIEALLFSSDAPLTPARIREAIPRISAQAIRENIDLLKADYAKAGHAFELVEIAEGFQLLTKPEYEEWIARLRKARAQTKLSGAALETLAIIAYKQPIRRVDVEAIRGVQSGELIRALMERGLVRIAGRADQPGSPLLYGTTKDFLDALGLKSLSELPKPEEVK